MIIIIIKSLGIDQGLANCGYGIIEVHLDKKGNIKKKKYIKCGVIRTSGKKEKSERVKDIYDKLKVIILKFNPQIISCEKLFFTPVQKGQRLKSASIITTNMITGIIYLLAGEFDVMLKDFVPSQVKKTITGNGRATKEEVRDGIVEILNIDKEEIKNEHKADGLSIAYTALIHYKNEKFKAEGDS